MGSVINLENLTDESLFIRQLMTAGFSENEATEVLSESDSMGLMPDDLRAFQSHFRDSDGSVNVAKVDAFMHIQNTKMTLDSYLPVLEERADNTDNETSLESLFMSIRIMHASGYSGQDIADTLNSLVKISKSTTPHPTEGLSLNGSALACKLVKAAENSKENREQQLLGAVQEIALSNDFGAYRKSNMLDDSDYSSKLARVHNEGVNELDRQVEKIILEETGEKVDVALNTGQRSWDYDADGKNSAEGFSMMMKLSTTIMNEITDLSVNLAKASNGNIPEESRRELMDIKHRIDTVISKLYPVYDRSRAITGELAKVEVGQREMLYRQFYENEYDGLFDQLKQIYSEAGRHRGLDFYIETVDNLDKMRKELAEHDSESASVVDESFRNLRRNGFALEKGQMRHNDFVYIKMLDHMFESDAFWGMGILNQKDREEMMTAGNFSELSYDVQYSHWERILRHAQRNENREKLIQILENANRLEFKSLEDGGNGYPEQEKTYADRMKLRSLYPFIFEEGVISDAQEIGSPRQKFIADLYGMKHMKHMSLNEDIKNLAQQSELVFQFNEKGGAKNMENRDNEVPDLFKQGHQTLHIMRPASDAERVSGSFSRLQAIDQYRKIVHKASKMKAPIEVMIGGGQSLNRFGGDVDMVRRILAQELKDIFLEKLERGEDMDEYDDRMIIMATGTLYTEQGRTSRYASATSDQVMDNYARKLTNIIQDYLDLKGHVADNTFIDKRHKFSPEMDKLQRMVADRGIAEYDTFNRIVFEGSGIKLSDSLLLDSFCEKAGAPNLISTQNNGARPEAGKAKGKSKKTSSLRAIGKDQTLYTMQSFHAGFFASGGAMERFYDALHDDSIDITQNDIDDLMNDKEWNEAIFSRNLIDAGRFNATHLFERLSDGDASKWNFDRAIEIGRELIWKRDNDTKKLVLSYKGDEDVTQEQLYLCKIYYDRAVFLAMTEAALTPKGQGVTMGDRFDKILKSVRPSDNSLEFGLGERTDEKWSSVEAETLRNHRKNAPAYALYYMVNDDIQEKLDLGISKDNVMAYYGGGNPKTADARFRKYGSALRSGTLPHKAKWTGKETYGMDNRTNPDLDMAGIVEYARNHGTIDTHHELNLS